MSNNLYSTHIFLFPFIWEADDKENRTIGLETKEIYHMIKSLDKKWISSNPEIVGDNEYNEYIYFYPWVRNLIYNLQNNQEEDSQQLVHNFKYNLSNNEQNITKFRITMHGEERKEYELKVDAIQLKLYHYKVGVLSVHLNNTDYKEFQDILNINEFGRRIYSPFSPIQQAKGIVIPEAVSLEFADGTSLIEDFINVPSYATNQISNIILGLLEAPFEDNSLENKIKIIPTMDDRMFIMSWYGNDFMSNQMKLWSDESNSYAYRKNSDWYQYVFIDHNGPTCVSKEMFPALTAKHTYTRWIDYGTLFGITHYSFMLLTDESQWAKEKLTVHMDSIYYQMVALLLAQNAAITRMNHIVLPKLLENMMKQSGWQKKIREIYLQYTHLSMRFFFQDITAQDQGKELYKHLFDILGIQQQMEQLKMKIELLEKYNDIS